MVQVVLLNMTAFSAKNAGDLVVQVGLITQDRSVDAEIGHISKVIFHDRCN